jgi:hypothetical protein
MKSTEQIHHIVMLYGGQDRRKLMKLLKELREQAAHETKTVINVELRKTSQNVREKFKQHINHYQNGT